MEDLKKFTNFIAELKIVQTKKPLDFPKVAIIGSPHSGKTSLLQCILGMKLFQAEFTHKLAYLEVILKTAENISGYAFEIQNIQEKFREFEPFRARLSSYINGLDSSYTDSVTIEISSNSLPYLTLIDLPGLAEISVDTTDEVFLEEENRKKKIVKKIIRDDKILIVCMLAANDNFKESRALEYAREYDPQEERTLGVISKYDLLETESKKAEIRRTVNGKDFPLKHGYSLLDPSIAFRNLAEDETTVVTNSTEENTTAEDDSTGDRRDSKQSIVKVRSSQIEQFISRIKKVFCFTLRTTFPGIFNEFQAKAKIYEEELDELGEDLDIANVDVFNILWKITSNFCLNFRDALSGSYMGIEKSKKKRTTLACGAYIRNLLHSLYLDEEYNTLFDTVSYTDEEIENTIKNHNAVSLEGFITSNAFKLLVFDRLQHLEEPAYKIFQQIYEALVKASVTLLDKHFARLPDLKTSLEEFLAQYFAQEKAKTMELLKPIIKAQLHYVYCNDPEKVFQNVYRLSKDDSEVEGAVNARKNVMADLIHELKVSCKKYCESVMFSLRDCIPKIIGQFFLDEISNHVQVFLTDHIKVTINDNPSLLKLTESQKEERARLLSRLRTIRKLKQYLIQDSVLYQFLRDPNLEENIFNKYQRMKSSYFQRIEENGLKLKAKRKAELDALKKNQEKKHWIDRFKNWFQKKSKPAPKFGLVSSQQPDQGRAMRQNKMRAELLLEESMVEESFMVNRRPRANSLNMKGDGPKDDKNALISDFVIMESYYNADQESQSKILSKTDWMRVIADNNLETVPQEVLVTSLKFGIPSEMRISIWMMLAGAKKLKAQHPKFLYERLSKMDSKWDIYIEKDVPRTRSQETFFKKEEYHTKEKLTRILKAYASYDIELGYTQGMNELVGVLLMIMSNFNLTNEHADTVRLPKSCEKNTFWLLVYIMKVKGYRASFVDACPQLMENIFKFEAILREEVPDILDHMEASGVTTHSAFTHLFLTLICQNTPVEFSVRIIDVYLFYGEKVLFDVLLRVVMVCKKEIMSLKDEKLFAFFKHDLMNVCFAKYKKELNKLLPDA